MVDGAGGGFKRRTLEDSDDAGTPLKLHGTVGGYGNGGKQFRSRTISQKCSAPGAVLSSLLRKSEPDSGGTATGYIRTMAH